MSRASSFKNAILKELLTVSSLCCSQYGSRSQLATEADNNVKEVIDILEAILSHGLKNEEQQQSSSSSLFSLRQVGEFANSLVFGPTNTSGPVLWDYVKKFLSRHELERYLILQHVFTDAGRGRAWLRTSLNEHSLGRYLSVIVADETKLAHAYEEWAFLRDGEKVSRLLDSVKALSEGILFALTIDKSDLDRQMPALNKYSSLQDAVMEDSSLEKLVATLALSPGKTGDCRNNPKRRPVKVVMTFDDEPAPSSSSPVNVATAKPNVASLCVNTEEYNSPPHRSSSMSDLSNLQRKVSKLKSEMASNGDSPDGFELMHQDGSILLPVAGKLEPVSPSGRDVEAGHSFGDIEERLIQLESKLDAVTEEKLGLEAELEKVKKETTDAVTCYEIRIKTLNRENELLKAQLKKYVSAVQLLKQDGEQAYDTLERLKELNKIQLHQAEQEKYEEKLVQVAEMHAELMEFNTRLQRSLQQKESLIRRLQDELVDLRGPLPVDNGLNVEDDGFSVISEDDGMGQGCSRTLINIWIPSAFLAKNSGSEHHVYQVYVRIRDEEWNIYRRFSQFFKFHKQLIKQEPLVGTFDFPPKKTVGNKESKCVEDRRKRLQWYLRSVVNLWVTKHPELGAPDKETLLGLLPFFGDAGEPGEQRSRFASRFRSSQPDVRRITSPQYDGL